MPSIDSIIQNDMNGTISIGSDDAKMLKKAEAFDNLINMTKNKNSLVKFVNWIFA